MIISPGRGYIFVHIPKTGGTSLARALEAHALPDDLLIGDTPVAKLHKSRLKGLRARGRLWKHSTLADIDGVVAPDQYAAMLIFALVRNPWDRLVSYYHWARAQRFDHPAIRLAQSLDFPAFLRHPLTVKAITAAPYSSYVLDVTGTEQPALYLRLEHLAEDWPPLVAHLGFTPQMPHSNPSDRHPDYRTYFDDALADHVATLCALDVQRFGYRF